MPQRYDRLTGPLDVTERLELFGSVDGDVHVHRESHFQLCGILRGNLTIDLRGSAEVFGVVEGDVTGDGKFSLHGVVTGSVTARAIIHGDSIVGP